MKRLLTLSFRLIVTIAMLSFAVVIGLGLWDYYMEAPWTRDGRVRVDVVAVAPDVSGLVTDVLVADNQDVQRGDVLFRMDPERFSLALRQAEAVVVGKEAANEQAAADYQRYSRLSDVAVTQQKLELARATALEAKAAYEQAMADRDLAKLNLARSEVRASVNGRITNMDLRPGAYVSVGHGVMALIDSDTLRVEGYFEETKLPRIHIGDPATIRLMGETAAISGRHRGPGKERRSKSPRQRQPDLFLGSTRATRPRSHRPGSCSRRREAGSRPNGDSVDQPAGGRLAAFSIEAVANNSKLCLGHEGLLKIGSVGRWTQRYAPIIRSISGCSTIFR
jgi:multidrug resistance efflux pump